MSPPPLPKPVDFRIFYGRSTGGIRRITPDFLQEKVVDAHIQARDWINENPHLEIISITSGDASAGDSLNLTAVTVWHREP